MANLTALEAELSDPSYKELTDGDALAVVKLVKASRRRAIPASEIKKLWGRRMILARCRMIADSPEVPMALRVLCRATYDNLMGDLFGDLDPSDKSQADDIDRYLTGLIAAGAMTPEDRADTLALATTDGYSFEDATQNDVWIARGQP